MSVYTIRYIEVRKPILNGTVYKLSQLPSDAKEGDVYKMTGDSEYRYFKMVGGQWIGMHECEYKWCLATPFLKLDEKPKRASYTVNLLREWEIKKSLGTLSDDELNNPPEDVEETRYYENEEKYETFTDSDGNETYMKRSSYWCNNGGSIRDEYIRNNGYNGSKISGRGFPVDMSRETTDAIYGSDKTFYGYDATWVTLDEWENLYDEAEDMLLNELKSIYEKKNANSINAKLDFIIDNMKDPLKLDKNEIEKEYEEDYYESVDYLKDEIMPRLYLISSEIGKAEMIVENSIDGYVSPSDIRIIYYLEH